MKYHILLAEEAVEEAANEMIKEGKPDNNFSKVLAAGNEYKAANMTPFYTYDYENNDIYVYTKETFGKKLH